MQTTETDRLIRDLARQAGRQRPPLISFGWSFLTVSAAGLAAAVLIVVAWLGVRPGLLTDPVPFVFKIAAMLAIAVGAGIMACRLANPGQRLPFVVLLPGVMLLALRGLTDQSGLSAFGVSDESAMGCLGAIIVVAMPALAILLALVHTAAPTAPKLAGAMAGLVSGAIGGLAYSLACRNDAGLFLMLWYTAAVLVMMAVGALVGRRVLVW